MPSPHTVGEGFGCRIKVKAEPFDVVVKLLSNYKLFQATFSLHFASLSAAYFIRSQ